MWKFPKIRYPNDPETDGLKAGEVVVTEKLDGANFRFTWDDNDELVVGTRNYTYQWDDENLPKAFGHAVEYVQNNVVEDPPQNRSNYTLYGEAMHRHSLDYDGIDWHIPHKGSPHVSHESETPNVVIFDAWDNISESWLNWDGVITLTNDLGFETTRVLERGAPDDLSFEVPEESMFGGPPEGIVARRVDGSVRAKKVTDNFKEQHNGKSSGGSDFTESDAGKFTQRFITRARVRKVAHKLVDEGEYDGLQMQMMEDLPREVLKDAMAENGWELLTSGGFEVEWDDDFKGEVRSKASKKCARVLKNELQSL